MFEASAFCAIQTPVSSVRSDYRLKVRGQSANETPLRGKRHGNTTSSSSLDTDRYRVFSQYR